MPNCTNEPIELGRVGRRVVEASFDGGDIASDGGVLLLRQVDQRIGLTKAIARVFEDRRRRASVSHSMRDLLAQRVYGLCCGWEDVCDHNVLRRDLAMQTAVGRADDLASAPTLSRLETSSTRAQAAALHGVLLDQFIASKAKRPKELVLDIDATHMPLHGAQEKSHFHRYYDNYCYLPLYVFCGQDILACVLRPSSRDPAGILSALIKLISRRLRQAWPRIRIIVRGDSGFCRHQALRRFEKWGLHYIVGLQKNSALLQRVELAELALAEMYQKAGSKQRMIGEFTYAAGTWDRQRRVIARLEHDARGANPRFIVTNLTGGPKALYERVYCARGEAENRIKEAQLDLFGRRASCHKFQANQLRLLLAAFAYTLMINLRRLALVGTELARACTATIRIKLLKIGAAVVRNTRRVRVLLASQHPLKHVFLTAARALAP
ncbi:Transposase [Janthinobacterium sp. CG23_2]|nr:Transposase [Janthinobacterium sp. CG23_2]CUI08891.1 Transposase [Janthinobacterium sp. CG23_2]CUU28485.1 Transposase [Janthinobacterium sp. CG23_2]CUU32677.1 Transposase [Janthinobacterium sp. CG23_2]